MKYRWRDLAFDVDDDLNDQTMVVLTRGKPGEEPRFNLCIANDEAVSVMAYVDEALREMAMSVPGFRLVSRETREVLGSKAVVVVARALSPDGTSLVQKQAFVERRQGPLVVITGSAREDGPPAQEMGAAVDRLLSSLSRET